MFSPVLSGVQGGGNKLKGDLSHCQNLAPSPLCYFCPPSIVINYDTKLVSHPLALGRFPPRPSTPHLGRFPYTFLAYRQAYHILLETLHPIHLHSSHTRSHYIVP